MNEKAGYSKELEDQKRELRRAWEEGYQACWEDIQRFRKQDNPYP